MAGRFEKMFIGIILVGMAVSGLSLWATPLFQKYGISYSEDFGVLQKTAALNGTLQSMYNQSQSTSGNPLEFVYNTVSNGWNAVNLIFSSVGIFLTMPTNLIMMAVPEESVAAWANAYISVIVFAIIVMTIIAIFISKGEGEV